MRNGPDNRLANELVIVTLAMALFITCSHVSKLAKHDVICAALKTSLYLWFVVITTPYSKQQGYLSFGTRMVQ